MKKKFMFLSVATIAILSISFGYGENAKSGEKSQLTLENVDALSQGESPNKLYFWPCRDLNGGAQCIRQEMHETCTRQRYC